MNPSFEVPAEYFYALTAHLPHQVTPEERYQLACLEDERRMINEMAQAIEAGVIDENPDVNRFQAARRLRALGAATVTSAGPDCPVTAGSSLHDLVTAWLGFKDGDIATFWTGQMNTAGHLDLVLCAVTRNHTDLIDAIRVWPVEKVEDLANKSAKEWQDLFGNPINTQLLPPFTAPGTPQERLAAFLRYVRRFFDLKSGADDGPELKEMAEPPRLQPPTTDHLEKFFIEYEDLTNAGDLSHDRIIALAADKVFPDDPAAQAWLEQAARAIIELRELVKNVGPSDELRFSIIEGLYARGFTSAESVRQMSREDFRAALAGSVAYDYADDISQASDLSEPQTTGFRPINPYGLLTNCLPPPHRSPFGPVAYLSEMLKVWERSTCEKPLQENETSPPDALEDLVGMRRGPLDALAVTRANLETPLPLIDIVNENLEFLAAVKVPKPNTGDVCGVVYDTNEKQLDGHTLRPVGAETSTATDSGGFPHDPATLFEVLPEHSSPATPVEQADAYVKLKADFSAPELPYSQPLDVCRTYLRHLGTSRYRTMRRFRQDITEFVLDPAAEPEKFQRHLWRYPVRIDIAREYLGITPEEYQQLFTQKLPNLHKFYGFESQFINDSSWLAIVVQVSEFLKRTGLTYCQFIDLWRAGFVKFHRQGDDRNFSDCEPCDLNSLIIEFDQPKPEKQALEQLAVFIRLWRKLQDVDGARYSFAVLRDLCAVLCLFQKGKINPDFIRQLAAFQMLRDHLALQLADKEEKSPLGTNTGADRTHLLALWGDPKHPKFDWAIDELLDQIRHYAQARHHCPCRPPEFIKLLAANLDPLSRLAGFDPDTPAATWRAKPTHTLRFAEVLAKVYASDFGVGELPFLFTTDDHLDGDDPFPLQPDNEALDSPLGLPDDTEEHSLWALRRKLLAVDVTEEEARSWTWTRIDASLRDEFGFASLADPDPLLSLGEHFFPTILEACGCKVDPLKRQYRVPLDNQPPQMWNTPPDGPFQYDQGQKQLWTQLPLTDEAVVAKLSRIRKLSDLESKAVRELYCSPRADLAPFAFFFGNFGEAEERLIQEPDEAKRWAYFQREFARCHARCRVIAEHLARHVAETTGQASNEGMGLAWRLLRHLFADENRASTPWEAADDSGAVPEVTWKPQPNGGAFAALLGLTGTGLLGELYLARDQNLFTFEDDQLLWEQARLVWREVRGPMDAFGPEENAWNAPIPTVIPAMNLTLSPEQQRFVGIRNGFALSNPEGKLLGGAQGFAARWSGVLLIENEGPYTFRGGAPTPDGTEPDFAGAEHRRWRVTLARGQRTWILLSHQWPDERAPAACSAPLPLRRGAYQLIVEFIQPHPAFSRPEEICPQTTGFQVKYSGPDSENRLVAIPLDKLFRDVKNETLAENVEIEDGSSAKNFLERHFTSTLRDIRRTYQRAFKALLFAHRFALSAKPVADDATSEIDYLLAHDGDPQETAGDFAGRSYYRNNGAFATHLAYFNFNFLPLKDNYHSPERDRDQRAQPSTQRRQALFDWWERLFDYTTLRREAQIAPERPIWLLFHEAAERHPDNPAHLLRHMGVDLSHADLVLRYYRGKSVSSPELEDERWAIRVWRAETWIRDLLWHFSFKDIGKAHPDLWASDDPSLEENKEPSGNGNLTQFVRDGCFENGEPRRYLDVKGLNDGLRLRARQALLAYLCGMDRIELPWGGYATEPKHLSELLLLDVEAGLCQRASRIEEAISAVQTFVQRARLGLEALPANASIASSSQFVPFNVSPEFILLWDRRFVTFHVWEACKRRETYTENWIDWPELEKARRTEGFRFLESELRRATLTVPVPGGGEHWPNQRPPMHPGLTLLQAREPALMQLLLQNSPEGLNLLGTPERHARPSWLSAQRENDSPDEDRPESEGLPFWIQTAIRLGTRFWRVAAAGRPPAATGFAPWRAAESVTCCIECGKPHVPVIDEYYFWLLDSRHFTEPEPMQDADWGTTPEPGGDGLDRREAGWHDPGRLPRLLNWPSQPMVHLAWCRLHNGEFQQPRRSFEGVRVGSGSPELEFLGRKGDSLSFKVSNGVEPPGYPENISPGFRYDLATDSAIVLPRVIEPQAENSENSNPADQPPYFVYFAPGARLAPPSLFGPAVAVAGWLRTHCRFEAALKWYERVYNPLQEDSTWRYPANDADDAGSGVGGPVAQHRAITLHYLDTLLEWGDAVMHRNSPEAFQQARLIFDTAAKILGPHPHTVIVGENTDTNILSDPVPNLGTVAHFEPLSAPLNPRLLVLYEQVRDRLALIHACLNARRLRNGRPNKDMPYWGNSPLRDSWRTTVDVCAEEEDWCHGCCLPYSPYRFLFLVQKAQDLANEVRNLGAALLAAFEKGDAEYLASLRATQELQLLNLALEIRQNQWREADWQVQALQKTKEMAQTRKRYYETLIQNGLNSGELQYESFTNSAKEERTAANMAEGIGQGMNMIPDVYVGFPCNFTHLPVGTKLAAVFSTIARIANTLADIHNTTASLRLTQAGWVRRDEEWRHQVEVIGIEIEQVERQILAAERRRDIGLRELNNHQRQIEHATEVRDFLRDKFTNHALYLWLQQETAALHYQMYELALHAARQAQRAFNYERGHLARKFLPAEAWDNLHEGLQAGERLQLSLRRMEKAYLDENCREYELAKHISLRLHFPMQFLRIRETGSCEIEIPEWMFDLDYPGHYMRRIKNVTLTIPCVVGPYTGVHCRLTLLSSITRVDPRLTDPPHACCATGRSSNGYQALPNDSRIVSQYAAVEAIATSSGQNDAGMFEVTFRDERYLPFEFAGAISRWRIELPKENNDFDFDTLSDLVIHLNYTAREGGEPLRRAASELAQQNLPGAGWRFFDVRHEFPNQWQRLAAPNVTTRQLGLELGRTLFPFLPHRGDLFVNRLAILFEVAETTGRARQDVEFTVARQPMRNREPACEGRPTILPCLASAEWPNLYHGVLDVRLGALSRSGNEELGTFGFPSDMGRISRVFLFCGYEVAQMQPDTKLVTP